MHTYCVLTVLTALSFLASFNARAKTENINGVTLTFAENIQKTLSDAQKQLLIDTVETVTEHTTKLLPTFPRKLSVRISLVELNLDHVGGVSGVALTPTSINIDFAANYKYGIDAAIKNGFKSTLYHEYHHLAYGWSLEGNQYGPGIAIASVVEGLATVFAENYSGVQQEWLSYPENVSVWVSEILELPVNAPYETWMMGTHPDGRQNIGYRAGKFIIHQAMEHSENDLIQLSKLSPFQLLHLSGTIDEHAPSIEKLADFYAKTKASQKAIVFYERAIEISPAEDKALVSRCQKKIDLILNPITLSPSSLQKLSGSYSSDHLNVSVLWSEMDNELSIQLPGKPPFELHPDSLNSFFIYEADMKVTFSSNSDESGQDLIIDMFGRELLLRKH